jgi:hypothetical protein
MRPPRVRFTMRRMMVAVAVLAVLIAVARYRALSKVYWKRLTEHSLLTLMCEADGDTSAAARHDALSHKYWYAWKYPWLPVAPDPPEPE